MIELDNVTQRYGDQALFSGVSVGFQPGRFYFLTGPSGSGKSTLLKLCYAELRASEGAVSIFGSNVRAMSRDAVAHTRRRIGVIHQDCQFIDHLTISENIALPLVVSQGYRAEDAQNLQDLLAWVGLSDRAQATPPELSGGERQRAALARAVIVDPEVILADEPTGNVDWEMADRVLQFLIELNRMGKTVVVASHDLNLIRKAKSQVPITILRIRDRTLHIAGGDT